MPLQSSFLFIEPELHYLKYGSVVLAEIVQQNRMAGQTIIEVKDGEANPQKVLQLIRDNAPYVTCGIGHGGPSLFSVECTDILIRGDSPELALFKDSVVSLCSCLTAQLLGPAIIDAGAVAYTGYKDSFFFFVGDDPGTSRAVNSPFLAEFQFVASLLRGKNTGDARKDQLSKYDEEIAYWTSGDGKNDPNAMELARILEMNKSISVFLGQGDVVPSPQGQLQATVWQPIALLAGILAVGYLVYKAVS